MARHQHRVRVDALAAQMSLNAAEIKHLQVMRVRSGDSVLVFDGRGAAGEAELTQLDAFGARLKLLGRTETSTEYPQPVTLGIALLKGDKLSDVVRAATELGVAHFQLLQTRYADVPDIGENKLTRLRRIAEEAAKQSQRSVVPEIAPPMPLAQFRPGGQVFYAHPGSPARLLDELTWYSPLTLISGPEGGFSPEDLVQLGLAGAAGVTLGPRILRAETAPMALLGALAASGV
ncbi:16S rRNA (uracil(1498)-N(3))-methyltransferase [Deinococcus alpinitundrae]|uniref:16S rRNA (uracil(1498)-N(3))-methyltransferase n=1 Tax=Deinococcus alpinitundrae TaxID=468913 RepID=UPI00137B5748|nr:16S rRNA (uracil(1498)-N(3))-methyltransferase [Deinococcus alpinitundrae]